MIWNQRKQNVWLWFELLLISVVLWFIVDYMYVMGRTYTAPLGFDIEHTYLLTLGELSDVSSDYIPKESRAEGDTDGALVIELMERMRAYPGVEAVSCSDVGIPYTAGSRNLGFKLDTLHFGSRWLRVSPDYFKVFNIEGEGFTSEQLTTLLRNAGKDGFVASVDIARDADGFKLAVGQELTSGFMKDFSSRLVGISGSIRRCEYDRAEPVLFIPLTDKMLIGDYYEGAMNNLEICFRVNPDVDGADFIARLRSDLAKQARVGNIFLMDIKPMSDVREGYIRSNGTENDIKTMTSIAIFLLVNIFLGVIGTFWFRTEYRKGEMGLRMALGSTRGELRMIMAGEGIMLLLLAFIPSMLISLNIVYMDMVESYLLPFTLSRYLVCSSITLILIACMIFIGIWYPALSTSKMKPADALHYE